MGEPFKSFQTVTNFRGAEALDPAGGERLAGEGSDDRALDNGSAYIREIEGWLAGGGKVAGKCAEEGVARSGGIGDLGEREGRAAEEGVLGEAPRCSCRCREEHRSKLAELDDDVAGSLLQEALAGENEVGGSGELPRLAFVDDEEVDLPEDIVQPIAGDVDPEVHRVGDDEGRGCCGMPGGKLLHDLHLVLGRHVGQDHDRAAAQGFRDSDLPVLEDIDGDLVGGAVVHVLVVLSGPGEGGAFGAFDAFEADAVALEHVEVLGGEVMADDADQMDRAAGVGGGKGGVGGGSAEEVLRFGVRGFHVVDGDGADDEDRGLGIIHAWGLDRRAGSGSQAPSSSRSESSRYTRLHAGRRGSAVINPWGHHGEAGPPPRWRARYPVRRGDR